MADVEKAGTFHVYGGVYVHFGPRYRQTSRGWQPWKGGSNTRTLIGRSFSPNLFWLFFNKHTESTCPAPASFASLTIQWEPWCRFWLGVLVRVIALKNKTITYFYQWTEFIREQQRMVIRDKQAIAKATGKSKTQKRRMLFYGEKGGSWEGLCRMREFWEIQFLIGWVAGVVDFLWDKGVTLIFTQGHISLEVAFKGLNVILGLYKCNYSLIVQRELSTAAW